MTDNEGTASAGWFHAEGDPPGTQRYWDGSSWQGEPQAAPTPTPSPGMAPPPSPSFASAPPAGFSSPTTMDSPKKKSSVWKWVLGILLVLVLGVGACSVAVFRAVSGPIDAANEFLGTLQAENYDDAWAMSDESCFVDGGPSVYEDFLRGAQIESYDLTGTNVESTNGVTEGYSNGTITLDGNDRRSVEIYLTKSGDDWLVCGFDVGAEGSG